MKFPPGITIQEQLSLALARIDELEDEIRAYRRDRGIELDADWMAYLSTRLDNMRMGWVRTINAIWQIGRRKGLVASREAIFNYCGYGDNIDPKCIDVYVCYLRTKLGADTIITHVRFGFSLSDDMKGRINGFYADYQASINGPKD